MTTPPDRIQRRLTRVFKIMFPNKPTDDIPNATMDNTEGWDSLGTLSLFTLIEEEFNIQLGLDLIPTTKSYQSLITLITEKIG